ncbi:MAG TPA: hypothetical protein VG917_02535 [Patescibacteria group bacterium]|nr:hypothetical protein [Patescibacteria group bacterium]
MRIRKVPHTLYYVIELIVLLSGFFSVYMLSFNFRLQEITLAIVLLFYALIGIFHHKLHHDLRRKIVIEYVLVSILIFACFLFLSTGTLLH